MFRGHIDDKREKTVFIRIFGPFKKFIFILTNKSVNITVTPNVYNNKFSFSMKNIEDI